MWKTIQLSSQTKCFLCDSFFDKSNESYILYKCFFCKKFTFYCFFCSLKAPQLFHRDNFFNCFYCKKLTNALDKIQINPLSENHLEISNNPLTINKNLTKFNNNNDNKLIIKKKITNFPKINLTSKNHRKKNNLIINNNEKEILYDSSSLSKSDKAYNTVSKFRKIYEFSLSKSKIKTRTFEFNKKCKLDCRSKVCEYNNNVKEIYFLKNNNNNFINGKIELKPAVSNFRIKPCELKNIFLIKNGSYGFSLFNDRNIKSHLFIHESKWDDFEKLEKTFN